MSDAAASSERKDPRVEAALREYLERVDRGERLDPEEFLARHPEIAGQLRTFLAAEQELRKLAQGTDSAARAGRSTQSFTVSGQATVAPRKGGKAPDSSTSAIPREFGRYRIVKVLGKGAMGTVYLAEDTQLQRPVALKTPQFDQQLTDELLERFYREARAAGTLRHPNICPVYDVGQIGPTHYISMAYIEGHPLSAFVNPSKSQPERQVLIVIRKLAQALAEAHEHGIVHRDLKPANIMIDTRSEPIVMDFGLARQVSREKNIRITQTGMLIGTPAYMSPEQVDGEPDKVGPPSDQFSLGVILYELLTGQLPFRGSLTAVMAQILTKEAPPPSQLRPDLDPRIDAACLKMLAKDPAERFASLAAVAQAISEILKSKSKAPEAGLTINPDAAASRPSRISRSQAGSASVLKSLTKKTLSENDLTALEELARKCQSRRDYDQVIQLVERVPLERRTDGLAAVLAKARDKADEISFLICEIDEAVRLNDGVTALKKADALLLLKPGHHRALQVKEEFAGFGAGGAARIGLRQFTQPWSEGGWIPWSVLGGGAAVFCAMTAFIVLPYLNQTTLTVQVDDRQVTVALKGQAGNVTWPSTKKFTVEAGDQELTVGYRGVEVARKTIRLKTGDHKTVVFSVVDQQVVMKSDGDTFTFEPQEKIGPAKVPLPKKGEKKQIQLARIQPATPRGAVSGVPSAAPAPAPSHPPEKTTTPAALPAGPVSLVAPFNREAAAKARQQWADSLNEAVEITNSIGMNLGLIPPGQFLMGSTPDQIRPFLSSVYPARRKTFGNDEYPQHRVRISHPYWMGTCEVTRGQFAAFVRATKYKTEGERDGQGGWGPDLKTGKAKRSKAFTWRHPGYPQGDSHPVVDVSWNDAVAFCEWLSQKEGKTYRLPTEAEWEYACRAGTTTVFSNGDDPEKLVEVANIQDVSASGGRAQTSGSDGYKWTAPVGSFRPNAFGLYDMHGNVWEWCQDRYDAAYYGHSAETDPTGPSAGERVSRGGALDCPPHYCLSASRDRFNASERTANIGFRVMLAAEPLTSPSSKIAESPAALPEGFVPLFDGKSLAGWKTHPSQPGNWRVENGVLFGSGSPASHLYTQRGDFKDFDLRVEARINEGGNSGVLFRTSFGPRWPEKSPKFPRGYEAQIDSSNHPAKTGSLFVGSGHAVVSIREPLVPPGQWFAMEVIAQGSHIVIKVNGREVVRHDDSHFGTGHIALQQLEPQTVVEFRKIEIKELGAGAPRKKERKPAGQRQL